MVVSQPLQVTFFGTVSIGKATADSKKGLTFAVKAAGLPGQNFVCLSLLNNAFAAMLAGSWAGLFLPFREIF